LAFKLISKDGDGLPIALKFKDNVQIYIDNNKARKVYDGILPKVESPLQLDIKKNDIVIFDMVGAGKEADFLKKKGITVIGAGTFNDKVELDRDFGTEFMSKHGIQTPPTTVFVDFDKARDFIKKTDKRYVFKPNGNLETDLTYVSTSAENLLYMLPYLERKVPPGTEFDLQEFVEGVEMSTEAWFNGEHFLLPINSTMEEKKFMNGGLGPNTGCMGNVVWFWDDEISEFLYKLLFQKLEPELKKVDFLGPLDINCIWTNEGPYGLEWTARFGYDAIQAMSRLLSLPMDDFFINLLKIDETPVTASKYALSIRVSIPPYPLEGDVPELPIGNYKKYLDNLYFSDVYVDKEDKILRTAGFDGYILAIAEDGNIISNLQNKVYAIADDIELANKQYRTDIGDRVPLQRKKVEKIIHKMLDFYKRK